MNLEDKKAKMMSYLKGVSGKFKMSGEESPDILRKKQILRLSMGASIALLVSAYALGIFDSTPVSQGPVQKKPEEPVSQNVADLSTPLSSVKDGDVWVSRIEKLVKGSQEEMEKIRSENLFLEKQINTLVKSLGANPELQAKALQELQSLEASVTKERAMAPSSSHGLQSNQLKGHTGEVNSSVHPNSTSPSSNPQHFPGAGNLTDSSSPNNLSITSYTKNASSGHTTKTTQKKKRKLLHLSNANYSDNSTKSPDTYLPAGTYFKVVTAMGVVVGTGTNSSADPQPILLRIVDNGNLPGGLKGKVKDAVLIGTCYGSASAERAICRLKTLSWRDKSNRNIEKPIEGWIASEDGVQGIRAKMIDRSSEIAREAFGAGLISAAANFFKMQSTSGQFPMSPFGQTNALSPGDAIKGAVGGGVGSAMDRLAAYSINKAEAMSAVAYVASGRILDAVLMRGVDLSPLVQSDLQLVNSNSKNQSQEIAEPEGNN
ncbi:MAG: TrbI/VirB10 family protein [Candidatus Paracaedibacter sp.]